MKKLVLSKEYMDKREIRKNTIFYSPKSKKSLSRIEVYPSGANRIFCMPEFISHTTLPEKKDVYYFSDGSRKRYFNYINSLNLEGYSIFFLTLTISSHLYFYLTKENLSVIRNTLLKRISNKGFDYVYKLEYTKKLLPHFHVLIYSKIEYGFKNEDHRILTARKISSAWSGIVSSYIDPACCSRCDFLRSAALEKMSYTSAELQIPENLVNLIHYFSNYTSKTKDYQNQCPEKFQGIRFWGYGKQNYPEAKEFPMEFPITQKIYEDIYRVVCMKWKEQKINKCLYPDKKKYPNKKSIKCSDCSVVSKCMLYRKNGLYHPEISQVIDRLIENKRSEKAFNEDDFYYPPDFPLKYHNQLLFFLKIEFPSEKLLTIL